MLYDVAIRLTSPLLGEVRHPDQVRRFARTREQDIRIHSAHWNWAFREAASSLHLDVDAGLLRAPEGIRCPMVVLYNRHYTTRRNNRAVRENEMFEAVRENTVLSFELVVLKPATPANIPSEEQVQQMLSFIGKFVGISQWGNDFGYGRFTVDKLAQR